MPARPPTPRAMSATSLVSPNRRFGKKRRAILFSAAAKPTNTTYQYVSPTAAFRERAKLAVWEVSTDRNTRLRRSLRPPMRLFSFISIISLQMARYRRIMRLPSLKRPLRLSWPLCSPRGRAFKATRARAMACPATMPHLTPRKRQSFLAGLLGQNSSRIPANVRRRVRHHWLDTYARTIRSQPPVCTSSHSGQRTFWIQFTIPGWHLMALPIRAFRSETNLLQA